MSNTYPSYNYSSFPDSIDQFDRFTDLTLDTIEYARQYNTYMTKGDLSNAAKILSDHPELKPSLINAANLNRIIDAIKCIETFYAEDVQKYLINIIKYRNTFSTSTKYSKYDLVIYNDLGYLCISSDTPIGTIPTNTSYFTPLTLRGKTGESGLGLSFIGNWTSGVSYSKDDAVSYGTCLYASIDNNNLNHTPSKSSSYWNLIIDFNTVTAFDNSSVGTTTETTMQGALEELYDLSKTNKNNISINAAKILSNTSNINSNTNSIADINSRISKVENIADKDKSVKYAVSAGTANSATSATNANYATSAGTCTGNSATATSANYATSAGNSDAVDGFHFQLSSTDLVAGSSSLATNVFYFVYE